MLRVKKAVVPVSHGIDRDDAAAPAVNYLTAGHLLHTYRYPKRFDGTRKVI